LTGVPAQGEQRASHRVIADHMRATSFLIADGVLPSNEGRGYVLRRIMRRAMRHAHLSGARDPVLYRMVPTLIREMGEAYPELGRARSLISETLELEENRFRKMLDRGLGLLDEASSDLGAGDVLDGEVAFKLYDTYGFPLDLTQDALRARSIAVDTRPSMRPWSVSALTRVQPGPDRARLARMPSGLRSAIAMGQRVSWLRHAGAEGMALALVKDGAEVDSLAAGEEGAMVVNQTPFYAESGGQQGDQGIDPPGRSSVPCARYAEARRWRVRP
jgi:alanyl-tRNA synthetase